MRLTAVNQIGQVCSHLCCEVSAVFPAEVYALHEVQHEGLQMHRKFSTWIINSEHASFAMQLNAITLKKQARVCSPGGIRVWKTEWRAQNRLMRDNSSLMAQGAGKPCLLQTSIQNLQRTASAPLQTRALRWNTARSCALKNLFIQHQWSSFESNAILNPWYVSCKCISRSNSILERFLFFLRISGVWLRISVPFLMQMFSAQCALSKCLERLERRCDSHALPNSQSQLAPVRKSPWFPMRGGSKHCKQVNPLTAISALVFNQIKGVVKFEVATNSKWDVLIFMHIIRILIWKYMFFSFTIFNQISQSPPSTWNKIYSFLRWCDYEASTTCHSQQ